MSTHRTVLVIADFDQSDNDYGEQLQQDGSFSYQILTGQYGAPLVDLSRSHQIDGILIAFHAPHSGSFDVLRQLKHQLGEYCPLVVVMDNSDADMAVQAFKHGAADYLVKTRMTADDLRLAMRSAIANAELQRERQRRQEQFQTSVENMNRRQLALALSQPVAALEASQTSDRTLAEAMPLMVWTADATGAVNYWNQRWYKYSGLSEAESMGLAGVSVVHPDERDRTLERWKQSVARGEPFEIEYRLRRWDGVYHWFISQGVPTRDRQGQIMGWSGTITNIDDQKQLEARLLDEIASHKHTEQELRTTNQKVVRILESMTDAYVALDRDWRITYINQVAADINHVSLEELIGRSHWEVWADTKGSRCEEYYNWAIAHQTPVHFDYFYETRQRWYEIHAYPSPDGLGIYYRDVHDRKQIETLLRESQIQLQRQLAEIEAIYQSAPIGLNVLDPDLRFVRINQQLADTNGLPVEAHIGHTVRDLFPDLADTVEQLLRPILETGEPLLNVEICGETPAQPGVKRTWREHFLPLKQGDQVIGISTVCEEITERIQVEKALRQSEERFRNMADHAPVMIWVTDATGCCTYLSNRWYTFTGQTEATGLRFGWLEAVHPDDRDFSKDIFLRASKNHEAFQLEYRLRRHDGEYRWAIDAASPWLGEDGEFKGYIGSVIDISDRKQAEEALRRSEERYRTLFESIDAGFCVIELLFDDNNQPVDYQFVEVNPAFEKQTGLLDAKGKRMRQLVPTHEQYWFDLYGAIAMTGEPMRFENRAEALRRWYDVYAFRIGLPEKRRVAVLFNDVSERKQVEQELSDSEARFRTLADNISQLAWMTDEHGEIVWYNQRWFDYTGTTLADMQRGNWRQVHHPDYVEQVVTKFHHCIATGETWEDTFPLRSHDGQYRWFLSRAVPVRDQPGKVLRWFGTNTDITDLRQTELALQQATERLNIALKSSPLTLFNQDLDLRYTWVYNPTQNYSVDEVIGQRDEDLVSPETAAHLSRLKRQVINTGVGLREEVKIIKDSQVAYYDLTIDPIWNDQNVVVGLTCAAVDISDRAQLEAKRQQTEQALRQSEERYRCLAELIPQLVWTANSEGSLLDVNQRWSEFTGLTLEQARTTEWAQVVHPDDVPILFQQWNEAMQQGQPYQAEGRMRRADGVYRWYLHQAIPQTNEDGQIVKWFGTATDIEAQKQLEVERDRLLQLERTAREAAERANRIKDEFLAVLSHELRSPLNPILGWTKLLQTRQLDAARTAEALNTIERNAKLQTQLIDDLLDVAKILQGKLSLTMSPVNLTTVIEAAIDTVKIAAVAKSISFQATLPTIGQVSGDATRLQQVVWNLLSNAIKFTPEGGHVEISLSLVTHQSVWGDHQHQQTVNQKHRINYAQIQVKDSGKGITSDFLPYIFESFRQEDASITRKYGGLGLGLAIVRQLVEAHGGTIAVNSPGEGLGATFTVRLPLLAQERMGEPEQPRPIEYPFHAASPLPSRKLDSPLAGIRVLTVDDDPDARELLTALLAQYGAEVLTVTSAAEVLANLGSFQPDVLVSDIGMPEVDGYSLIQQVRMLSPENGGQTPAIALTAYARDDDRQRVLTSGYQQHVTKPLEPDQLVQAVARLATAN